MGKFSQCMLKTAYLRVMGKPRQLVPLTEVPEHRPWTTVRWLRRAVYERKIPFHKLGDSRSDRVLIDLVDLDAYAERGRVDAAT
jgi:hypothetical protein